MGRAYRRDMEKKHFNRKRNIVLHTNAMSMGLGIDHNGVHHHRGFYNDDKPYTYIRRPKNSRQRQWLRKYGNRQFRRTRDISTQEKRYHRKVFNALWELW